MNFDLLVRAHSKYQKASHLPEVFGDGYLFHFNPIYRNIRNAVQSRGYTFTDQDFCNYRMASLRLAALPQILSQRKIPYTNTAHGLAELSAKFPRQISTNSLYFGSDNTLLHESCHCLAEDLIEQAGLERTAFKKNQLIVLRAAVAEAFALATDAMACLPAQQKTHVFFYSFNSYMKPDSVNAIRNILKPAVRSMGAHAVYKVLIYSALLTIFLHDRLTKENGKLVLSLLDLKDGAPSRSREQLNHLRTVSSIWLRPASGVEAEFYSNASRLYFTMIFGKRPNLQKLFSFSPLEFICANESLAEVVSQLAKTAISGLPKKSAQSAEPMSIKRAA